MATLYSTIYDKFTTMFTDLKLAKLSQATFEELLELWISESSAIHFKESRVDLSDRDETLKQFNNTLSEEAQWIVAYGMQLSWLDGNIYDEGKLKNMMGDRDYKTFSPANLLKSLESLREKTNYKLINARERYDFDVFELDI